MPRLTDSDGLCYRCGERPHAHDMLLGGAYVGVCGPCYDVCRDQEERWRLAEKIDPYPGPAIWE